MFKELYAKLTKRFPTKKSCFNCGETFISGLDYYQCKICNIFCHMGATYITYSMSLDKYYIFMHFDEKQDGYFKCSLFSIRNHKLKTYALFPSRLANSFINGNRKFTDATIEKLFLLK